MDRELTVLLVEDDQQACCEIAEYIDTLGDMLLIGVTNNAEKAVQIIQDSLPDAIILDLELHYGAGNGLTMLQELKLLPLSVFPYILITTNNSSVTTYELARQLGADFILSKHQTDYSSKGAVDFLRMMKSVIQSRAKSATAGDPGVQESPERTKKRLSRRISAELDRVGISTKARGYQYLIDAIQIVMDGPTQNLCTIIGKKYGKTESSVERAMQNAIGKAWRSTPIDDLLRFYTARINSEKGVPTLTEFIYYYANKLKNEN